MTNATEWNVRGIKTPRILKQSETPYRWLACLVGIAFGICISIYFSQNAAPNSSLAEMFDFHEKVQVAVPLSILSVFFWGLFLCLYRLLRIRGLEKIASAELANATAEKLETEGIVSLAVRLTEPTVKYNPLLRRIKTILNQWQVKPGLVEADVLLQQFAADDEEATRRGYGLVRTFIWALPVLGLIGTVLGIASAVHGFSDLLGKEATKLPAIKASLVNVTVGLSFAFLLTLLGLATSLILMFFASALESSEERFNQAVGQRVVEIFLPRLQRLSPMESGSANEMVNQVKMTADSLLEHLTKVMQMQVSKLSATLDAQQAAVSQWGSTLFSQASVAANTVKGALDVTASTVRDSGNEFKANLDQVRKAWTEQTKIMQGLLAEQSQAQQTLVSSLQSFAEQQTDANETLAGAVRTMRGALDGNAEAVRNLGRDLKQLSDRVANQVVVHAVNSDGGNDGETPAPVASPKKGMFFNLLRRKR